MTRTDEPGATPPTHRELEARILDRRGRLSARLVQAADFVLTHPDEVAFGTVASVAAAAGVPPSALVRLAQSLDLPGFSALQAPFRERLRDRGPDHRERLARLRGEARPGAAGLLARFADAAALSLDRLRHTADPQALERAAAILAGADTIHLLALRRAFPVAASLAYALARLGMRCHLVDHVGGLAAEQLGGARAGDALVAVSFTPYTPATIDLANAAAARGVPVVAITDSPFSPLAPAAAVRFDVVESDAGGFRSLAATMSLAATLAVLAGEIRGREAASG